MRGETGGGENGEGAGEMGRDRGREEEKEGEGEDGGGGRKRGKEKPLQSFTMTNQRLGIFYRHQSLLSNSLSVKYDNPTFTTVP